MHFILFRFATLHQRTERVDSTTGQSADRAFAKHQLGRRIQISRHHSPYYVLWK